MSRPAPSRRKTPDPGRVFVAWTNPVSGRRRFFAEPLDDADRIERLLEDCRTWIVEHEQLAGAELEAALESIRVER